MKTILFVSSILIFLIFASCSSSPKKSPFQTEAEQQAEQWLNSSFAKCNDTYATKYKGTKIGFGTAISSMVEGFIQIKNLTYLLEEQPLTESDRLNGVEWKGSLILYPIKPTLRYFDLGYYSSKKWSDWIEKPIIYHRTYSLPDESKSPFLRDFKKVNGEWKGLSPSEFNKIDCSELPPD